MPNDVSADLLLAFLDDAWTGATADANSLLVQLQNEQSAAFAFVKAGSIGSIGKNSSNQTYKNYGPGTLTHTQIVETWSTLVRNYRTVKAKIECAFDDAEIDIPQDYDFDPKIYEFLTDFYSVQATADKIPDIRDLRIPLSRVPADQQEVCA